MDEWVGGRVNEGWMKGGEKGEWVGKHQILSEFFGRWDYRWFFLFASLNFLLLPLLLLFLPPPPPPPPRFCSYSFLQWKQITCIINKVIRNPDLEESTVQWEIAEKTEANSFLRVLRQYELRSGPDSGLRFHCLSNPALTTSKKPSFSLSLSLLNSTPKAVPTAQESMHLVNPALWHCSYHYSTILFYLEQGWHAHLWLIPHCSALSQLWTSSGTDCASAGKCHNLVLQLFFTSTCPIAQHILPVPWCLGWRHMIFANRIPKLCGK